MDVENHDTSVGADGPRFGRCTRCGWPVPLGQGSLYKHFTCTCWPTCADTDPDGEAFTEPNDEQAAEEWAEASRYHPSEDSSFFGSSDEGSSVEGG